MQIEYAINGKTSITVIAGTAVWKRDRNCLLYRGGYKYEANGNVICEQIIRQKMKKIKENIKSNIFRS